MEEPDCYGVINLGTNDSYLFVPKLPADYAIWQGKLHTLDDFKKRYGVEEVHYTDDIASVLKEKGTNCLLALVSRAWEQMDALAELSLAFPSILSPGREAHSAWGIIRI